MTEEPKKKKSKRIPKARKVSTKNSPKRFLTQKDLDMLSKKHEETMKFSFIYFDNTHELFNCGGTDSSWFVDLFINLKSISNLKKEEFLYDPKYKAHYDPHQHNWEKIEESKKYNFNEEYFNQYKDDCWQFRLSTAKGRVHGFIRGNTFYIIWLDPHHNFYPDERFGGEKYYSAPLTPYQHLEIENHSLKEKVKKLEEDNNFYLRYIEELETKEKKAN